MEDQKKEIKMVAGLRELPRDKRDFNLVKVFGTIEDLPTHDFLVADPLGIKDQKDSDMCTAFSMCAVSEAQEGVELSPEWQFAKIKEIDGNHTTWGADLRTAAKSFVKFGSIEQQHAPYNLTNKERNFLANIDNWPFVLYANAKKHKKQSYFKVDASGYSDLFDGIRAALWQNRHRKRFVPTGCLWEKEWNSFAC